jgi:hypothetical protein
VLRALLRASRYFDSLRSADGYQLQLRKSSTKSKKQLTADYKIDNLEKFAKTSLAAEVILDESKLGRQEARREI